MKKYEYVASEIYQRIQTGEYPINSLLPSQNELAEEFGVSRLTVKKALDSLIISGMISSQRGLGTRVLKTLSEHGTAALIHNGLSSLKKGQKIESIIIKFEVILPDDFLQEKLEIPYTQPVYDICRFRKVDGEPFVIEHTYMPVDLVPDLTKEILLSSIYQYLQSELKIKFAGAYRTIHADKSNELDWKYLECQKNDPILEVMQSVYLANGRIIEYSTSRNRYDKNSYSILDVIDAQN